MSQRGNRVQVGTENMPPVLFRRYVGQASCGYAYLADPVHFVQIACPFGKALQAARVAVILPHTARERLDVIYTDLPLTITQRTQSVRSESILS